MTLFCQDPPDQFNHDTYPHAATYIVNEILLDGEEISDMDWIGAFVNGECRGASIWTGADTPVDVGISAGNPNDFSENPVYPEFQLYIQELDQYLPANPSQNFPLTQNSEFLIPQLFATLQDDEIDCVGVIGGTAFIDDCGYCVGGTTGLLPNFADLGCGCDEPAPQLYFFDGDTDGMGSGEPLEFCDDELPPGWVNNQQDNAPFCPSNNLDDCGVCDGGNADMDCFGNCFGGAELDDCGICGGNGSSCNAPQTNDIWVETIEDQPLEITLEFANPSDQGHTIQILIAPLYGAVNLNADNMSVVYIPDTGYAGEDQFHYVVSAGNFVSNPGVVYITVIPENDPPMPTILTFIGMEDRPLDFCLVSMDGDSEDGDIIYDVPNDTPNGALIPGRSIGTYAYLPNVNFNGIESFSYSLSDGETNSDAVPISLMVTPVNDRPELNVTTSNEEWSTVEDTPLTIGIATSDVEEDALILDLLAPPLNGTVSFLDDEQWPVLYTPNPDYYGSDMFVFTAREVSTDEQLSALQMYITIAVSPVNDSPIVTDQQISLLEDSGVALVPIVYDPEGDEIGFELYSGPQNGSIETMGSQFYYIPDPNYFGSDLIEYIAFDYESSSAPAQIVLNVMSVNDAPQLEELHLNVLEDGLEFTIPVIDIEGDPIVFEFSGLDETGNIQTIYGGSITPLDDEWFHYQPPPELPEQDQILVQAWDGTDISAPEWIIFHFANGRPLSLRTPPVALQGSATGPEDLPLQISLVGVDIGSLIDESIAVFLDDPPDHGQLEILGLTYFNPNVALFDASYTPDPEFSGPDVFNFHIENPNNPESASAPAVFQLTVLPVDDPPHLAPISAQQMDEDTILEVQLNFWDPDSDLELSYESDHPEKINISHQENILQIAPSNDWFGWATITVRATETGGALQSVSRNFSLEVIPINDAPVVAAIPPQVTLEEEPLSVPLFATDVDSPPQFQFRAWCSVGDDLISLNVTPDSLVVGDTLQITPLLDRSGNCIIHVTSFDELNIESVNQDFGLLIKEVNDPPTIPDPPAPQLVSRQDGRQGLILALTPEDVDEGSDLTLQVSTGNNMVIPEQLISIEPVTAPSGVERLVTIHHVTGLWGTVPIALTVTDGFTNGAAQTMVTIDYMNTAPMLADIPDIVFPEDQDFTYSLDGYDLDADELSFTLTGSNLIEVQVEGNMVTFSPSPNFFGVESFTLTVSDNAHLVLIEFDVTVTPVSDPPQIISSAGGTAMLNTVYTYVSEVLEVDGDTLEYLLLDAPEGMSVSPEGVITWLPTTGTYTSGVVTLVVTDAEGLSDQEQFAVVVLQPAEPMDCAGVPGGSAFLNECGCVGGTTGLSTDYCYGCTDPDAWNFEPLATQDDDSCEYALLGDLVPGGGIDIIDLVFLVDIILNTEPTELQFWQGDVNMDGELNIVDVVIMVEWILLGTGPG